MLRAFLAVTFAALGLVACTPQESHDAVQAACNSATVIVAVATPYAAGTKFEAKVARANDAIARYCDPSSPVNAPNAVAALAAAMNGLAPLVKAKPALLSTLHRTPAWQYPAFRAGWAKL